MKRFKTYSFLVIAVVVFTLQSCSISKHIPEGERLYLGADLILESEMPANREERLKGVLAEVVYPKPNKKFLGGYIGLYYYYKMQKDNPGFINRFFYKKFGEEPVYQSQLETSEVLKLLHNRLENRGYFFTTSNVSFIEKKKKASVNYHLKISSPYRMSSYTLDSLPEPAYSEIQRSLANTFFREGRRFDLANMKRERQRIDIHMKEAGYYNFNPEFLKFEADTNSVKKKAFQLFLGLKDKVPEKALVPYKVERINVYAKYDTADSIVTDLVRFNGKNYINSEAFFKSKYLDPYILLKEGEDYDAAKSKNTTRRLSSIGLYKYVNLQYKEIDSLLTDTNGALEVNIYLSSLNKRALRAEFQAVTKSNSYTGPGLTLTSISRNLFRGGEVLNLTAKAAYEFQAGKGNTSNYSLEAGLKSELVFPRVLFPINFNENFFKYNIPKTIVSLEGSYLHRSSLYTLLSGTGQFGYSWQANSYSNYKIAPISINYTKLFYTSERFDEILEENTFLKSSFDQKLIAGMLSSYTYNELVNKTKKHQFYLNTNIELIGNTASLLSKKKKTSEKKQFLGLEYAQFAKVDLDLRYHINFEKERSLAMRLYGGYGLAYGNSDIVPYIKQFYSGGPYSVRAFSIRSLGPGTFSKEDNPSLSYFDQTGNIRLEANIEYRFPIYSFFKGAFFVDAGNVWNSDSNAIYGNKDKFTSKFLSELGMGAGLGLRIDVQGFVIRFDLASPFHDPSLSKNQRYNFKWKNTVLNFAIGYPF